MKFTLVIAALAALPFLFIDSGKEMKIEASSSKIQIHGTSTLHDWTEDVTKFTGSANLEFDGDNLKSVSNAKLNITVKGIKSGKSGMDSNTYKALNEGKHPNIILEGGQANLENGKGNLSGSLSIAGTKKNVSIPIQSSGNASATKIKGAYKMKMTDFNVDPPKAMMGTISTGDDIEITFDITLK